MVGDSPAVEFNMRFFDDKFSPYEDSNIFTSSNENRNTIKK